MTVEYLLVVFPGDRDVLADGDRVGVTNHTLLITANEYTISLGGTGYVQENQDVVVANTSIMRPKVVSFSPATGHASVAAVGGNVLPENPGLPKSTPRRGRGKRPAT